MQWIKLTDRMPNPDEHGRVLIYTEGHDFNGEQVFDVQAETLNECFYADPEDQPEVCKHASHWAAHPRNAALHPTRQCAINKIDSQRILELTAENESLREQRNRIGLCIDRALNGGKKDEHEAGLSGRMDAIRALRTQLAEAQKDAERYSWLRMNRLWLKANLPTIAAPDFDDAIDAAKGEPS